MNQLKYMDKIRLVITSLFCYNKIGESIMKEEYKKILKVWLVLYVVFTVFKIINTFNQSILDNIFSHFCIGK